MKVICISNSGVEKLIQCGVRYTVYFENEKFYRLEEAKINPSTDQVMGFRKSRFIPISEIDETTFERNYNKELV